MTTLLSAFFLLAGSTICLIAAMGVLRLPDFFLRMHAATKAGVAGAGLVLIGVGFAEPSAGMWLKVVLAIVFLLLTTPVAGHLLARAGYVAGVPLWGGTYQDELKHELPRGAFDRRVPAASGAGNHGPRTKESGSVIVALTEGSAGQAAIAGAVDIARATARPLIALAIVDTKMLANVGPVPIGGNHYAAQLRRVQIEKARHALAATVEAFERQARAEGIPYSLAMEEGDPVKIIRSRLHPRSTVVVARDGWFDHGIASGRADPVGYLVRRGIYPLIGVADCPGQVHSVAFVHDGTPRSDDTLGWLLERDPWPDAAVHMVPYAATRHTESSDAMVRAAATLGERLVEQQGEGVDISRSQVVVFGNERHDGWFAMMRAASRPGPDDAPIVVFG